MQKRHNTQSGFTLVELIIVIIILGILAATALPRFAQMQVQARIAKLQGIQGAVNSAAVMAYGLAITQGIQAGTVAAGSGTISVQGVTVNVTNNYPDASAAGIIAAIGSYFVAANMAADNIGTTGGGAGDGKTITIQALDAATPANCSFTYTNDKTVPTNPTVSVIDTSAC